MYNVILSDRAKKHYAALDRNMCRRVNDAIAQLAENPYNQSVKLRGKLEGYYRYRVGNFRIIYSLDTDQRTCMIYNILHRSRAYN